MKENTSSISSHNIVMYVSEIFEEKPPQSPCSPSLTLEVSTIGRDILLYIHFAHVYVVYGRGEGICYVIYRWEMEYVMMCLLISFILLYSGLHLFSDLCK